MNQERLGPPIGKMLHGKVMGPCISGEGITPKSHDTFLISEREARGWMDAGVRVVVRSVQLGESVYSKALSVWKTRTKESACLLAGLAQGALLLTCEAHAKGARFSGDAEWLNSSDIEIAAQTLNRLLTAGDCWFAASVAAATVDALAQNGFFSAKRMKEEAPPPAVEPIRVEVVSMPPRRTDTEISYNKKGEIVSTVQVEADMA